MEKMHRPRFGKGKLLFCGKHETRSPRGSFRYIMNQSGNTNTIVLHDRSPGVFGIATMFNVLWKFLGKTSFESLGREIAPDASVALALAGRSSYR